MLSTAKSIFDCKSLSSFDLESWFSDAFGLGLSEKIEATYLILSRLNDVPDFKNEKAFILIFIYDF